MAQRRKLEVLTLQADNAGKRSKLRVPYFDPEIAALIGELRTDFTALKFDVLVVGATTANTHAFHNRPQFADFTLERRARLLHIDGDIGFGNGAVARAIFRLRNTDIAAIKRQ